MKSNQFNSLDFYIQEDVSDGEVESKPVIHLRECVNCLQAYDDPRRITQGLKCVERFVSTGVINDIFQPNS
eukprot:Awhi_evm1s7729